MLIDLRSFHPQNLTIRLARSKSLYIRYLISIFLKNGEILPVGDGEAEDVKIVDRALQQVKSNGNGAHPYPIHIRDCGAAWRFLTALLSIMPGKWLLQGSERIMQRPIAPLIETLQSIGADITMCNCGILINGKILQTKELTINITESSQFASAIFLIADKIGLKNLNIIPEKLPSNPYIEMTKKILERVEQSSFSMDEIEADWSGAAFGYAFAILRKTEICFPNLKLDSRQGDSILVEFGKHWNIESSETNEGVLIRPVSSLPISASPLSLNFSNCPDLAPVMTVLALLTNREVIFSGLQNLDAKESKRRSAIIKELSSFAHFEEIGNHTFKMCNIQIPKGKKLSFSSHQDHRLVMAFTLFSLYNEVEIDDVEVVKKSYPNFFNIFQINELKQE